MDTIAPSRRLNVAMELFVLSVALVSLAAPQTREAAVSSLRYLIGIPGRTTVEGKRGGCVLGNVPHVEFSDRYLSFLRGRAAESVDDYLITSQFPRGHAVRSPEAYLWRDHPLLVWAAIKAVVAPQRIDLEGRPEPKPDLGELIGEALRREPENGALAAAKGLEELQRGRDEAALHDLEDAARQPTWDDHADDARRYLTDLFRDRGMTTWHGATPHVLTNLTQDIESELDTRRDRLRALGQPEAPRWQELRARYSVLADADRRQLSPDPDAWRTGALESWTGSLLLLHAGMFWSALALGLGGRRLSSRGLRGINRAAIGVAYSAACWILFRVTLNVGQPIGVQMASAHSSMVLQALVYLLPRVSSALLIPTAIVILQVGERSIALRPYVPALLATGPYLATLWMAAAAP